MKTFKSKTKTMIALCAFILVAPSISQADTQWKFRHTDYYTYPGCEDPGVEGLPDERAVTCRTYTVQIYAKGAKEYNYSKLRLADEYCHVTLTNGEVMTLSGKNPMHNFGKFSLADLVQPANGDNLYHVKPFEMKVPGECIYKFQAKGSDPRDPKDGDDKWTAKPIKSDENYCQRFRFGKDKTYADKHPDAEECVQ